MPDKDRASRFREIIRDYYRAHKRDMPWRNDPTPYKVLVSELMLQQTQVSRVLPKFADFMVRFPTLHKLAEAPLADVLQVWSGLGYNRRAKFLHVAAQKVVTDFGGVVPDTFDQLVSLPGVGKNTAGAILAYAYNQPVVFVETNIRSVYFYHFFDDTDIVDDKMLLPFLEQTLDREHPREWYWALMDYGTYLKQTAGNNISRSKHYVRQSTFEGSRRQLRGTIIRHLLHGELPRSELSVRLGDARFDAVLNDLVEEGFVQHNADRLRLTGELKLP